MIEKLFLLEKTESFDTELEIVKDVFRNSLRAKTGIAVFEEMTIADMQKAQQSCFFTKYKNAFPIGSINFVSEWLRLFHQKSILPIEIPNIIRKYPYIKRDYNIVPFSKLPSKGDYFIKDTSVLKSGTFCGSIKIFLDEYLRPEQRTHNFLISSIVDTISEWRVYVVRGKIKNISNYDGNPCFFPNVELIQQAVLEYNNSGFSPNSYTMDFMITKDRETELIEVHPFVSVGLYSSVWDDSLLDAYMDGIIYCINN